VGGKPLIEWTIEHGLETADCRVVVSTDSTDIADVARRAGAEVPFLRDPLLAQDATPTEPVLIDTLDRLAALDGYQPQAVVLLQATSPVRRPGTVQRAIDQFEAEQPDSLVGVCEASPFLWSDAGEPLYDITRRPLRQDLPDDKRMWRETGSLYIMKPDVLRREQNRLSGRVSLFRMHDDEAIDIDTEIDLTVAESLLGRGSP
jgi:N-acylneuraminate cytidylyltransferase